jgi:hypothetical protein
MTRTDLISEDPSVIAAGFKARGMTNQEIEKLLKIYPKENATKEQRENFEETLSGVEDSLALRRDTKRISLGFLSGLISLSSISVASAAHTCSSPKTMYTCIGLTILSGLYAYSRFTRIGLPLKNEYKRVHKAELKALKKLIKEKTQAR